MTYSFLIRYVVVRKFNKYIRHKPPYPSGRATIVALAMLYFLILTMLYLLRLNEARLVVPLLLLQVGSL